MEGLAVGMWEVIYMLIIENMLTQGGTNIGCIGSVTDGTFKWENVWLLAVFTPGEFRCSREVNHHLWWSCWPYGRWVPG